MNAKRRVNNMPQSFNDACARLGRRDERRIANNTVLIRRADDAIAVRLHSTDIVTFYLDGRIELYTGGWNTITTRSRMRACLAGWGVWSGGRKAPNALWKSGAIETDSYYFDSRVTINPDGSACESSSAQTSDLTGTYDDCNLFSHVRDAARPTMAPEDIAGADDARAEVGAVYGTEDESRWADYNRKFNELLCRGGAR